MLVGSSITWQSEGSKVRVLKPLECNMHAGRVRVLGHEAPV